MRLSSKSRATGHLHKVIFFLSCTKAVTRNAVAVMLYFDVHSWLQGFILNIHGDIKAIYFYQKHPYIFLYIASPLQRCNLQGFVGILYFLLLKERKKDIIHTYVYNILTTWASRQNSQNSLRNSLKV